MRLSVALDGYWLDKQLDFSPNTVAKYRYIFGLLSGFLGDAELESVATEDIRRFLLHLRTTQGLGRRSVYDAWAVLSAFWSWAEAELGIPHIIRGKMTAPGYTQRQIEPYSEAELRALLGAVAHQRAYTHRTGKRIQAKSPTALRDKAIVSTLLDSGLRVSELCALTLADYDAARGRLHVRHGKGDKERYTVIGSRTRRALWLYLASRGDPAGSAPLFATRTNTHLTRQNVRHMLDRLGEATGVRNVGAHRFRHTFAINFLRNGGSPLLLQELLGHERLETVRVYVKLAEQDIDAGAKHSPADNWRL